jgi:ABC-type transport system involved in cytochrome bd biosynthesis fused ATPase/permease subunit
MTVSPIPIGTSIVLIAVGAILAYAVEYDLGFIDVQTAGIILMIVGILGLIISVLFLALAGRGGREREVVEEVPVRRRERL